MPRGAAKKKKKKLTRGGVETPSVQSGRLPPPCHPYPRPGPGGSKLAASKLDCPGAHQAGGEGSQGPADEERATSLLGWESEGNHQV